MYTKTFFEAFLEALPWLFVAGLIVWVVFSALIHLAKHPDVPLRNWWIFGIIIGLFLYGFGALVAAAYKIRNKLYKSNPNLALNPNRAKKYFAGITGFIAMFSGYLLVGAFIFISYTLIQCSRDPKCI